MKEVTITKTMYETVDKQLFDTKEKAEQHELKLEYHRDIISFTTRIQKMCEGYYDCATASCNDMCPFKRNEDDCALYDYPVNWDFTSE